MWVREKDVTCKKYVRVQVSRQGGAAGARLAPNYDRISLAELPNSDEQLMAFRVNTARARVNMVGLPSVAAAALLADGLQRLRELLPQHGPRGRVLLHWPKPGH